MREPRGGNVWNFWGRQLGKPKIQWARKLTTDVRRGDMLVDCLGQIARKLG